MRTLLLSLLLFAFFPLKAEVVPPNYNFTIDEFKFFYPGKKVSEIPPKYGKGQVIKSQGTALIYRFEFTHQHYKFPIYLQVREQTISDFFAPLPSYFLHDVFHQSLINRFGKQNSYLRKENTAVYTWENKNNLKHIYAGACSITCFPIYYSVSKTEDTRPLLLSFLLAE